MGSSPWEAWPAPAPPGRPKLDLQQRPYGGRVRRSVQGPQPPEGEEQVSEPWWIRQPEAISLLAAAMFSALYIVDQLALVIVALLGLGLILLRSLWYAE